MRVASVFVGNSLDPDRFQTSHFHPQITNLAPETDVL